MLLTRRKEEKKPVELRRITSIQNEEKERKTNFGKLAPATTKNK